MKRSGSLWLYGFAEDPIVFSRKEAGGSDSGRHGMSWTRAEEEILLHMGASTFSTSSADIIMQVQAGQQVNPCHSENTQNSSFTAP